MGCPQSPWLFKLKRCKKNNSHNFLKNKEDEYGIPFHP